LDPGRFFSRLRGQLMVIRTLGWWAFRTVRLWRLKPIRRLVKAGAWQVFRKVARLAGFRTRRARTLVRVAVLPIEEQHSIDAARLKSCKAAFAYEDVDDGRVKYVPACSWYPYRNPILERISRKYGVVRGGGEVQPPPAAAEPAVAAPL